MKRRLLLGYLGVTLFVLVTFEVPLGVQHQRSERRTLAIKVEHDATTLASVAEDAVQAGSRTQLVPVARSAYAYARSAGTRVVIVDARGRALVDTGGRVRGAESFASRPEIAAALKGGVATGTRYSQTLGRSLLYVAVPIASGGVVHGAVRVTFPTSAVDARIRRYWLILAAVAAVILAGAAVVGLGVAEFVVRPLRGLERAAAAVGEGELDARAPADTGPPEVRSLALAFNETVAKLARVLRSQQEFVADASHELRTPLTALRLRLENGDVDGALAEVEHLDDRIEGLLALARADAQTGRHVRVDAAAVIRERVEHWRPLADEQHVRLAADVGGTLAALAGRERLAQVLDNLLANALEAAPEETTITLSARPLPGWVELHVVDEGPGLTADQRRQAFERFWRAGSGGSGLGLAIVRRLVEADGGEVELAEADGGGVDAVVRLRSI